MTGRNGVSPEAELGLAKMHMRSRPDTVRSQLAELLEINPNSISSDGTYVSHSTPSKERRVKRDINGSNFREIEPGIFEIKRRLSKRKRLRGMK